MKKRGKIFAFIGALALSVTMLAGCGSEEAVEKSNEGIGSILGKCSYVSMLDGTPNTGKYVVHSLASVVNYADVRLYNSEYFTTEFKTNCCPTVNHPLTTYSNVFLLEGLDQTSYYEELCPGLQILDPVNYSYYNAIKEAEHNH